MLVTNAYHVSELNFFSTFFVLQLKVGAGVTIKDGLFAGMTQTELFVSSKLPPNFPSEVILLATPPKLLFRCFFHFFVHVTDFFFDIVLFSLAEEKKNVTVGRRFMQGHLYQNWYIC